MKTGLRGLCPRCGKGKIFDGFLKLKKACPVCGLDLSFADPADGPAFFVICFACIPSAAFAVWLEVAYSPAFWGAPCDNPSAHTANLYSSVEALEGLARLQPVFP